MKRNLMRYVLLLVVLMMATDTLMAQTSPWRDMHKVKRKETIYGIARDYGLTVEELMNANPEMKEPGFELKKGMFVCIPYPSNTPPDTTTTAAPSPKPVRPEEADMRRREIRLGVMLPLHTQNGDGRRMVEYYRGVLMACDSLRQEGISVSVHAWNVSEHDDITTTLADSAAARCDLIIGPLYSAQVPALSSFAQKNDISVLIPFSINTNEVATNPQLFQVYQSPQDFNELTLDHFMELYGRDHLIVIDCNDSTSRKGMFTSGLRKRFDEAGLTYDITNLRSADERFQQVFSPVQRNVVVLNTGRQKELRMAMAKMSGVLAANPTLDVTLFGYTDWLLFARGNMENFYKYNVQIPSAFCYDATSPRTKRIELKYRWNFHADMMNSLPHFAITGFDHTYFMVKGLHLYGKGFTGAPAMVGYTPIQTPLDFRQQGSGGRKNRQLMLINYTPQKTVEVIKF